MEFQFETLKQTRLNLLGIINKLSHDELNKIPEDFNNNIAWNFNHIVLVMHLLTYGLSGLKYDISEDRISKYKKGSKINGEISKEDIEFFKSIALTSVSKLAKDFNETKFVNYSEYPTSYNVVLKNIEQSISFNNVHEALHLGYILAQIKALNLK